jgi:hypothetical protein
MPPLVGVVLDPEQVIPELVGQAELEAMGEEASDVFERSTT